MMKNSMSYIFKRVLTFFIIFLILSFIKSCKVNALSYGMDTSYYTSSYWINNSTQYTMTWGEKYTGFSSKTLTNVRPSFTIYNPNNCGNYGCDIGIYNGNYLIDFYLVTDGGFNVSSCENLSHNFQNIDMNSGSWVSNQTYGTCIATSVGRIDNHNSLHILYSFELKAPTEYAQDFRFLVNQGQGFLSESNWFKFYMGGVYDYDQAIIDDFQNQALTNTIINQNTQIINGQQSIILHAHSDSVAEQNAINQNTQAQNETNNILNNDNISGAEQQVNTLITMRAFDDNTGIMAIVQAPLNFINSLNNTCTPIQVTIPYIDTPLNIPCIKQELTNHIPTIVPVLSTAINGFIIYRILLDIFRIIKSAREPDEDRIEVLDL